MGHWHVASGLAGYGPDGSDTTFVSPTTATALAESIRVELDMWADSERDGAEGYAEAGDYESAWKLRKHADGIETMRTSLDNERVNAPLYRDAPEKWDETILRMVAESFPYDVDEGRSRVYAWECGEPDETCEHLNAED